ncbi:hypothetical protein VaNZ11_010453 [Volvox africanus]|uniref:SAM-dependent MTase RsmB/NOP-type domain-containing protein n=1 Tax=Volvox africanus TaxID=51714 RepID=A0ABQ5S9L7_9CHLO|nr:hypothetical protein VaNZ11_010453 [Volvox africanus]
MGPREAYLRGALGDGRFEATVAALSQPPRTTCMRVNTLRTSTQEVVTRVRQLLESGWDQDVVRVHPQVPCAVILQGSGPHEVSYSAAGGREVIISRKAGEAVLRGAPVFAPGVLAVSAGVARGDLVALAVGREKPGSDVPEITRGTTLYTAVTTATGTGEDGGITDLTNTTSTNPAIVTVTATATSRITTISSSPCCTAPVTGSIDTPDSAAVQRTIAPGGDRRDSNLAPGTPGPIPHEDETGKGGEDVIAPPREGSSADPEALSGGEDAAREGDKEGSREEAEAEAEAEAIGAALPDSTSQSGRTVRRRHALGVLWCDARITTQQAVARPAPPPSPLAPGWTHSSQGPLPPRTGMYVGLARAVMSRQEMFRAREGLALELVEPVFRVPPAVGGLPPGWVMLQNLPSVVAALVLSPAPGSRVLDMCAAPGGKATLMAQIMGDKGEIVAFDRTHAKVSEIVSLAGELGVTCITARKADAGKALERPTGHQAPISCAAGQHPFQSQPPPHSAAAVFTSKSAAIGCGASSRGCGEAFGSMSYEDGTAAHKALLKQHGEESGDTAAVSAAATAATRVSVRTPMSDKARKREERRRAAMIQRGITPPEPRDASVPSGPTAYPPESFDHVLLDAPCSALGLRPRLQQQSGALYLRQCAAAQRRLVDAAVRLLRVGGSLVYSTCTINPGENEAIVRYLLDRYGSSLQLVPAGPPFLGRQGLVGRHPNMVEAGRGISPSEPSTTSVDDARLTAAVIQDATVPGQDVLPVTVVSKPYGEDWLSEAEAALVQRFDPSDSDLDTIGFFVAKLVKLGAVVG